MTPGSDRSAARSASIDALRSGGSADQVLLSEKILASSMPVGRSIHRTRCWIIDRLLLMMARVTAICSENSAAPSLLRPRVRRIGSSSMLLRLQLPGGLNAAGAQCRIQSRTDCGENRHAESDQHYFHAQRGEMTGCAVF